jgi:hypothetical protein
MEVMTWSDTHSLSSMCWNSTNKPHLDWALSLSMEHLSVKTFHVAWCQENRQYKVVWFGP